MGMNSHPLFISNITVNESQDGKVSAILGRHKRKIEVSFRIGSNYMNIEDHTFKKSKMTPVRVDINDNLNSSELVQLINGLIDIHNGKLAPVIIGSSEPTPFLVNEYHKSERVDKMTFELGCLNHLIDDEGNCFDKHEIESLTKIRDNLELNLSGESLSPLFLSSCIKRAGVGGDRVW